MSDLGDFIIEAFIAFPIADNQKCPYFQSVRAAASLVKILTTPESNPSAFSSTHAVEHSVLRTLSIFVTSSSLSHVKVENM